MMNIFDRSLACVLVVLLAVLIYVCATENDPVPKKISYERADVEVTILPKDFRKEIYHKRATAKVVIIPKNLSPSTEMTNNNTIVINLKEY